MTDMQFEELTKSAKPISIEDTKDARFGFIIVFDNGRKIEVTASEDFGSAYIEFDEYE